MSQSNSNPPETGKRRFTLRIKILLLLLAIIPVLVFCINDYFRVPSLDESVNRLPFIIDRGMGMPTVADSLLAKGLISDKEVFLLWLTTLNKDRSIKAGYYEIPLGLTNAQLISFLSKAPPKEMRVTLIEGWRIEEIARQLHHSLNIDAEKFIRIVNDSSFVRGLNISEKNLEGYLLPDTYLFYWGVDEKKIAEFLVSRCMEIFTPRVMARLDSMKMDVQNILTLASIIEGEAIYDDEREIISSVYHNRLKRRIKLQADPTIQYILKGPPRRLLFDDLKLDSPYNTYKYYGLPPGPISNPGKKSILAAIYPAKTKYIYFVAVGDGRHTFSQTAAEHNAAKAKFDRVRREVYKKQRDLKRKRDSQ